MKAAFASSLLFGCVHLSWIINSLVFNGTVTSAECLSRLYQVYFAFCFGMLCAGITLYTKSIIPVVLWHALVDLSAFIPEGILPKVTFQYYYVINPIALDTLLIKKGIINRAGLGYLLFIAGVDAIMLIAGIILVKAAQKRQKQ